MQSKKAGGKSYFLLFLVIGGSFSPPCLLMGMSISRQFELFRNSHAVTHRMVAGNDWSYIAGGRGDQTVVILPGGGGCDAVGAESMFPVILGLKQHCRVIAIGYPSTATKADEIVEGIRAILDGCGVRRACLLGHSLGGFAEQAFARKYPERVDALIIANCAVYSPGRMRLLKIILPIAARLPHWMLANTIRFKFKRLLKDDPDREFWARYMNQCETNPASKGLRNQLLCMLDFLRNTWTTSAKASRWSGRVLILESDQETGFTPGERKDFRLLYPGATVHVFQHAGHLSWATQTKEFVGIVADFLAAKQT